MKLDRTGKGIASLTALIPKGPELACECQTGECKKVVFADGAFSKVLADANKEILAVRGEYKDVLASRRRGSLELEDTKDGLQGETHSTGHDGGPGFSGPIRRGSPNRPSVFRSSRERFHRERRRGDLYAYGSPGVDCWCI